jgi:hypothetical protein
MAAMSVSGRERHLRGLAIKSGVPRQRTVCPTLPLSQPTVTAGLSSVN